MNVQLSEKKYHLSLNEMYMIPYILIMNKIIIKTHFIDLHVVFDAELRHCISSWFVHIQFKQVCLVCAVEMTRLIM